MKAIRNVSILGAVLMGSIMTQAASQAAPMIPARPGLLIIYPTVNLSVTNPTITLSGKTQDKVAVTNVWYQLNGGGWEVAATTNAWTNWTAEVTLVAGTNTVQAYAEDGTGTPSLTNTVRFTYAPLVPLVVNAIGPGTVTPGYNGKLLKFGSRYSITAKADGGCKFLGWSGSHTSSTPSLSFVMASNLTFTATFEDVTPPVLVVISPKVHQTVSAAVLTVTGKASDNVGVTQVFYQLNRTGWNLATPNPGWSNWMAEVTLSPGTNLVQAYAEDAAGNPSKTNSVSFVYGTSAPGTLAPGSLSGLLGAVDGATGFTIAFGATTFSQSMVPGADEGNNGVGTYTYAKLSANTARLTAHTVSPPATAGSSVVNLTFTDTNEADYSTTSHGGTVKTGVVLFSQAPDLAPTTLAGDTVNAVSSTGNGQSTIVFANGIATTTDASGTQTASYTFKGYSPVGGLITEDYTSPSSAKGTIGYTIVTWSAPKAGSYIWMTVPPASSGMSSQIDYGTFTLP